MYVFSLIMLFCVSVISQWYDVMITAVTHVKWTVREAARNLISMVSSMLRIAMELVKHLCIKINDIPTSVSILYCILCICITVFLYVWPIENS